PQHHHGEPLVMHRRSPLMSRSRRLAIASVASFAFLAVACGGGDSPDAPGAEGADTATGAASGTGAGRALTLTAADVTTATVRDVTTGIVLRGPLEPATTVTLTAQVAGTIGSMEVDRGSRVSRGQRLATINAEGVRSQAASAA